MRTLLAASLPLLLALPAVAAPEALRWQHTYADAMREARVRGVPLLVTRHKDG